MTKWELAQMMGLSIQKDRFVEDSYYAYADTSSCSEKEVGWFTAKDIDSAKEQAADEYFYQINCRSFRRD